MKPSMKVLFTVLSAAALLVILFFVLIMVASESGEVVQLRTTDAEGRSSETRVWIVDYQDMQWVRTGHPDKGWFRRLVANPAVTLTRGGFSSDRCAVPIPDARIAASVNRAFTQKYGFADRVVAWSGDAGKRVPVLLRKRTSTWHNCPSGVETPD